MLKFVLFIAMAGNIIPAIATTNAVIAGVVILKAFGILRNDIKKNPRVSFMATRANLSYQRDLITISSLDLSCYRFSSSFRTQC
jgi:hypothetical protein